MSPIANGSSGLIVEIRIFTDYESQKSRKPENRKNRLSGPLVFRFSRHTQVGITKLILSQTIILLT
jgi:hypothetical protein